MKKFCIYTLSIIFSLFVFLYLSLLFILPCVIKNERFIDKTKNYIAEKYGIQTEIKSLNFNVTPDLILYFGSSDIKLKNTEVELLNIQNLSIKYNIIKRSFISVKSNTVYINGDEIKKITAQNKQKKKTNLKIDDLPDIFIKKLIINSDNYNVDISNISANNGIVKLKAKVQAPYIKDAVNIGEAGYLSVNKGKILANNFEAKIGNSKIDIDGILFEKNKLGEFTLTGEGISVSEFMAILLHYQKAQDPAKKFIENFKNYSGSIDCNLKFNKFGIFGECIAKNLSANAIWFNIPLKFPKVVFKFDKDRITSTASGTLGGEKVIHTLKITEMGTDNKEVVGTMNTTLTKTFNYIPNLTILNFANASLTYKIKYKKIDVFYNLDIDKKCDLIYNKSYLGLRDFKRKIYAQTLKNSNDLYLKNFGYSILDGDKENNIIYGQGLFVKINDKYTPQYITLKTNGYAPVSVAGSFGEKIKDGEFSGNLRYDYLKNKITGTFDIINAKYKSFIVDKAIVDAKGDTIKITSFGTYKNKKYSAEILGRNNFSNGIVIDNMKLFLDKLILNAEQNKTGTYSKINPIEISQRVDDADITINYWEININEIQLEKFILENVKLVGSLKNNIFDFGINEQKYAKGILRAKGIYNFSNNFSKINFEAKNIDSNSVAKMLLNLQNQVEGTANAKISLEAFDSFKKIKAHCLFEIKEGFLPKLGNTEFMVKNSKYKISQITNLDLTQKNFLKSDIKGSFDVLGTKLKNINITSKQEFLALFLEGDYEIKEQYANIHLFGKYNKEIPKGIKVFFIPVNWIINVVFRPEKSKDLYKQQLSKIPQIKAPIKNTKYFRVELNGNINENKMDLVLKSIR